VIGRSSFLTNIECYEKGLTLTLPLY